MLSLRELQREFLHDLVGETDTRVQENVVSNGLLPRQRLAIYRNNVISNLVDALRTTYPVVECLVGETFFRQTAKKFINKHASTNSDLNQYGEQFADFLSEISEICHLVYLRDVARLEWIYQTVYFAADSDLLSLERLAAIESERWDEIGFELNPAMRLFASDYPVRRIWEANQADYRGDQTANLAEGQVKLLIARRVSGIEMQVLLEDEYLFLDGCARGLKLADAYQLAVNLVSEFDLTRALANYVRENVLVNFRN